MNKKTIISAVAVVLISIAAIVFVLMPNSKETTENNTPVSTQSAKGTESQQAEAEAEASNQKATFMYFVTNSDEENKELKATLKKLQKEYEDTVTFDIRNVDKDKDLLKNFPVEGNTPALIMLKPNGDIVNMLFATSEYDKLKKVIDSAF